MKKGSFIFICIMAASVVSVWTAPREAPAMIAAPHRVCAEDVDCAVVPIGCVGCGVAGTYDAVNAQYLEQYKHLEHCTPEEIRIRAAMDCILNLPTAVCEEHHCVVKYRQP